MSPVRFTYLPFILEFLPTIQFLEIYTTGKMCKEHVKNFRFHCLLYDVKVKM